MVRSRARQLKFKRPKIASRNQRSRRVAAASEPSFSSKVLKVTWFVWNMPGKWTFVVDGKEDVRRFKDWLTMLPVLKGECEQGFIRAEAHIVCRRVNHRATFNSILWWAIIRSWRS